jgi:hypothetical protein
MATSFTQPADTDFGIENDMVAYDDPIDGEIRLAPEEGMWFHNRYQGRVYYYQDGEWNDEPMRDAPEFSRQWPEEKMVTIDINDWDWEQAG